MSAYCQSSQSFVRALKAPTDPPNPNDPTKIEIAREAWDNTAFYVLNKGEVITDWILTRLLKDKAKEAAANPLADLSFWTLLKDVVCQPASLQAARPTKTWLIPLLNRTPLAPIVLALLGLFGSIEAERTKTLSNVIRPCFATLWSTGVHKITVDVLLDCFGVVVEVFERCRDDEHLTHICLMISASYRASLGNTANKKKIHSSFVQAHLKNWIRCVDQLVLGSAEGCFLTLMEDVYDAGIDTLFSLDALRQAKDTISEDILFDSLRKNSQSSPDQVLVILPRLFLSFVQCVRKHRGALFSQSSTQQSGRSVEDVKSAGMGFFASCDSLMDLTSNGEQTWRTRTALLAIVDQEKLLGQFQPESQQTLLRSRELAVGVLVAAWKVEQAAITNLATDVLSALIQIDYDLVQPALSRILPRTIIAAQSDAASTFLELVLQYHVKTRTVDVHILSILTALSDSHLSSHPGGPRGGYQAAFSGPVFSITHLGRLSKSIHSFLTPNQSTKIANHVFQALKEAWTRFYEAETQAIANTGDGSRKKRRKSATQVSDQGSDREAVSVIFSLTSRLASLVLAALPLHSVPPAAREELVGLLGTAQQLSREVIASLLDLMRPENRSEAWAPQIVAAACFRFQNQLGTMGQVGLKPAYEGAPRSEMLEATQHDETLPELTLEIFRSLMSQLEDSDQTHTCDVLDAALLYLERHFTPQSARWSGISCHLSIGERGRHEASLALLHLLVDRWLSVIDSQDPKKSLDRLVKVILDIPFVQGGPLQLETELLSSHVAIQLMHSAHFWELPNIRASFLSAINSRTAVLEEIDLAKARSCKNLKRLKVDAAAVEKACFAYTLLLYVPPEYYTRSSRSDLVRRALMADAVACLMLKDKEQDSRGATQLLVVIRVFLNRMAEYMNSSDSSISRHLLEHLINPPSSITSPSPILQEVTLDLAELHLLTLLRSSDESAIEAATDVVSQLSTAKPFGQLASQEQWAHEIIRQSVLRLIARLPEVSATSVSKQVHQSLKGLYDILQSTLAPQMAAYFAQSTSTEQTHPECSKVAAWSHLLSLGHWLGYSESDTVCLGQNIAATLLRNSRSSGRTPCLESPSGDICSSTLDLLFEELFSLPALDHSRRLDVIAAVYMAFSGDKETAAQFDRRVEQACKRLAMPDFSHLLGVLYDGIVHDDLLPAERARLVHLSSVLLHNAPQGTLKVVQDFVTRSVNYFASYSRTDPGSTDLRNCMLEFTAQHCSDRPAALRSSDIGSIWCLLSKILSGSTTHDPVTSLTIFHHIIATISALVRLRRDLVVNTLPHLGMVLRQLIMTMRSLRPQLGAKQSKIVTDTLPAWINPSHPLSGDEGRALARLLTTLTTKTVPRTHIHSTVVASNEAQKAESLAKAFSKHAAYVLTAYVDAINDPLCVLAADVRRELEPGLFSLCEMTSEYSRDAVMASVLDTGGKTILKALWKEFEKQRYVGKG
ncbi:hypothetical protein BV22DRAFT_1038989 [Leucogyrophana mollusca]|uniref:Uncharacterized protein n=1 Tax=Leucogyrophana mollusca TaxID=85980 RepID=A0ACB8B6F9_9AGAM|nr:hypothetical protein BV22DRAFT_1038989 [Leucogyrophana mollusca]